MLKNTFIAYFPAISPTMKPPCLRVNKMKNNKKCVLSIAGSDSSGGAGIQADIKAISATGAYASSVITAITAQNTIGVQAVYELKNFIVEQQLESVLSDLSIHAVKIGMVFNAQISSIIAASLKKYRVKNVVLDPVMLSKNGCALINEEAISILQKELFPLATLITPNRLEAEKISGCTIANAEEQQDVAIRIAKQYQVNVLLKGGHVANADAADVLCLYQDSSTHWFHAPRILSRNTHGTGCSLSSAIASYLAQEYSLKNAIHLAKLYICQAILYAKDWRLGKGYGPLEHFYALKQENIHE